MKTIHWLMVRFLNRIVDLSLVFTCELCLERLSLKQLRALLSTRLALHL